jgi:Ca-activated chloride channel family protein
MVYEWFQNIAFAYPYLLGLLAIVPVLWWFHAKRSRQAAFTVSTSHAFTVTTWKNRLRGLPFVFRMLSMICLILALARPQKRNDEQQTRGEGIDIILCIDVSGSMNSRDIRPSRMEVAKEVAIEFVKNRPVDRIGLVIFAGESFSQCPLTSDKNSLIEQLQSLDSRKYLEDGTVIGEGLATAVDRLSESDSKSKVIILLTDGKEDAPDTRLIDPFTALEIAKAKGVKVYTIGMSAGPVRIPEGLAKDRTNPFVDFIDEQLLQKISAETGGKYFRAKDREALRMIYAQIDKLEKSKVEITTFMRYEEMFLPLVLASLAFLILELLLRFTVLKKFP